MNTRCKFRSLSVFETDSPNHGKKFWISRLLFQADNTFTHFFSFVFVLFMNVWWHVAIDFDLQKLKMTKSEYENLIYTTITFSDPLSLVSEISSSSLSHSRIPVLTTTGPIWGTGGIYLRRGRLLSLFLLSGFFDWCWGRQCHWLWKKHTRQNN